MKLVDEWKCTIGGHSMVHIMFCKFDDSSFGGSGSEC